MRKSAPPEDERRCDHCGNVMEYKTATFCSTLCAMSGPLVELQIVRWYVNGDRLRYSWRLRK